MKLPKEGTEIGGDKVSLERFGFILSLFGPIVGSNRRVLILEKVFLIFSFINKVCFFLLTNAMNKKIKRTLYQTWFHGDIDKNQAEDRIRAQINMPGTYLIRFSSVPGVFTLSSSTEFSVEHRRITYNPNEGYKINGVCFYSLEKLIKAAAGPLHLKHPCPGSRFANIFKELPSAYVQSGLPDGYKLGPFV